MHETDRRPLLERTLVRAAISAGLLAVLFGTLAAVHAFDSGSGDTSAPTDSRGALDNHAPVRGEPAPNFELRTIDGKLVTLTDLRGQVVWINFWATWCHPCRQELPAIQRMLDEKRSAGLTVLTVNYKEQPRQARQYFEDAGLKLPMALDVGGSVYDQYRLQGLPDSFFVDRDGNLAAIQYGYLTEDKMRERLAQAGIP